MARRLKGEGTIQTRKKDGKIVAYRGAITIDGKPVRGSWTEKRSEALPMLYAKLRRLANEYESSSTVGPELFPAATILLENRLKTEWRPKTYALGQCVLKHIENAPIGKLGALEITQQDIVDWRLALKVSPSSAHRYQRILERFINLLGNKAKAPKPKLSEPDLRVLTPKEQKFLIDRCVQPRTKLAMTILIKLGIRAGEACGLMHEDRHLGGIWIRRQIVEIDGGTDIAPTKTDESRGWIPLPAELQALIGPPRSGFVLATGKDTPMRPSNLRRMVQTVASGSKLAGITPHELRHTAAVNLLQAGVDPGTAASITRHSVETLIKIYNRVTTVHKEAAMEKVAQWLESSG